METARTCHQPFATIPNGVLGRLNNLTSKSKTLENTTIDKIYSYHTTALQMARIAPKVFPTFLELEKLHNKSTTSVRELKKISKINQNQNEIRTLVSELVSVPKKTNNTPHSTNSLRN